MLFIYLFYSLIVNKYDVGGTVGGKRGKEDQVHDGYEVKWGLYTG